MRELIQQRGFADAGLAPDHHRCALTAPDTDQFGVEAGELVDAAPQRSGRSDHDVTLTRWDPSRLRQRMGVQC